VVAGDIRSELKLLGKWLGITYLKRRIVEKEESGSMVQLAAFPKCYLDDIIVHKSMTLFDWVEKATQLGVDGLEMYSSLLRR
jgi:hypothetical protein